VIVSEVWESIQWLGWLSCTRSSKHVLSLNSTTWPEICTRFFLGWCKFCMLFYDVTVNYINMKLLWHKSWASSTVQRQGYVCNQPWSPNSSWSAYHLRRYQYWLRKVVLSFRSVDTGIGVVFQHISYQPCNLLIGCGIKQKSQKKGRWNVIEPRHQYQDLHYFLPSVLVPPRVIWISPSFWGSWLHVAQLPPCKEIICLELCQRFQNIHLIIPSAYPKISKDPMIVDWSDLRLPSRTRAVRRQCYAVSTSATINCHTSTLSEPHLTGPPLSLWHHFMHDRWATGLKQLLG